MQKDIFNPDQYWPGHTVELVAGGEPFFDRLIRIIQEARKLIHLQVYIFEEDRTGQAVLEALRQARQRGVDIFLTVDAYGSRFLSPDLAAGLRSIGVHFKLFAPLPEHFYVFRLGRRLHNKVIVADEAEGLVGGINIADKYRGSALEAPWLDFAVAIQGPVCAALSRLCEQIYREKYSDKLAGRETAVQQRWPGGMRSRLAVNDWFRRKNQIGAGYLAAIRKARHSIAIVASYFLPNRSLRTALKNAARRGVRVALLLPGESDLPIARRATRYLYRELLQDGIEIYEWRNSILHGKLAVVDDTWATVGSYNLNHLSQYSSIELNVEVLDEGFAGVVQDCFADLTGQSARIEDDSFQRIGGRVEKTIDWAAYTLTRWMMLAMFFLVRREQEFKSKK